MVYHCEVVIVNSLYVLFGFWLLWHLKIHGGCQVKNLYVGSDFVGDVPLTKKILAALTTGELDLPVFWKNLKEKLVNQYVHSWFWCHCQRASFLSVLLMYLSHQSGAIGIAVANPTDLVKVRLQAEGKLPAGVPRRYSGAMNAYSTIVRQVVYLDEDKENLKI